MEQPKVKPTKGLMYVDLVVQGKLIRTLIDMGATDNFINKNVMTRLELNM